jgi:hypothetical protein
VQVKKIEAFFQAYEAFLKSPPATKRLYIWESQRHFQTHWDLEALDLKGMYDTALQNSQTRRLWNRETYAPKEMMLRFAELQPDYFRQMFKELFDENKSIDGRMGRFVFYCDQLFESFIEQNPKTKIQGHDHDDGYEIISLYLTFKYPMQYLPYRMELMQNVFQKIGAVDPPLSHDTERYFKVARTLYKLLQRILDLHQKRLNPALHYMEESLLLIYDFCCFIAEQDLN